MFNDVEKLNYFKNIENEISDNKIHDILYFNDKTDLQYKNIEEIIRFYCNKYSKKFFALTKPTELLQKGFKDNKNLLIFSSEKNNIDRLYNESSKVFIIKI